MNAIQLFHQDGRPTGIFYCEKCRVVHREKTKADECCRPRKCSLCGVEIQEAYNIFARICDKCDDAKRKRDSIKQEAERFEAAEKVTEWGGAVYCEGIGYNDGYFPDVFELLEYIEDNGEEKPEYVWTCDDNHFAEADIDDVVQRIEDNAHEGFDRGDLEGIDDLKAAIEKFNEANHHIVSWSPNYKKAVLISKE